MLRAALEKGQARRREVHEYESAAAPADFPGRCDATSPGKSTEVVNRFRRVDYPTR